MHCCPYQHWQAYVLGIRTEESIFTLFGTAFGIAIEQNLKHGNKQSWITFIKDLMIFIDAWEPTEEELAKEYFLKWCKKEEVEPNVSNFKKYQKKSFGRAGLRLYREIIPYFKEELKDWDIVDFEVPLMEPIEDIDLNFKGYIDCILKHKTEDRYKIIDFKTCSYGWGIETRKDTAKLYQVILYKKYWCAKNNIPTKNVDCAYLLLKRTPAAKELSAIEMFDQTSGDRKLQNAEVWMLETLRKIYKGVKIKTPSLCGWCTCGKR